MQPRPVSWMDNPNADRVKRVAQLAGRSAVRNRRKLFLAEGPQSAREALKAHLGQLPLSDQAAAFWPQGRTVAEVYYTNDLEQRHPDIAELIEQLDPRVFVAQTSQTVLQKMSDAMAHQDIIVVAHIPEISLLPDPGANLVVAMVRIQDPGNAGTIVRAGDAAGVDYIVATQQTVDIYNPKAVRSSAGSLFHLPVFSNVVLDEFVTEYAGQTFAADGYADITLDTADQEVLAKPTAWLFGNEAQGLNYHELRVADQRVAVPLYGLAESLNVSTAATICLYSSAMAQRGDYVPQS